MSYSYQMLGLDVGGAEVLMFNTYQSIPDGQRRLAATARYEFNLGNYSCSLEILKKLQVLRPQDVKVFHNMCVAEYYMSNCCDTLRFYNNMLTVCQQTHIDEDPDLIDDVDQCVVFYNRAVILYHLHKYEAAIDILDKVFQYVEPLVNGLNKENGKARVDEILTLKICFLLMELYLTTNQPKKALGVGVFVETTVFTVASKGNSSGKTAVKEIPDDMKAKLVQYKARCYTLMKTFKPCKREVKTLMTSGVQDQQIAGVFIKSHLEYFRNNHRKALRILSSAQYPKNDSDYFLESGDLLKVIHFNNIACIHYCIDKSSLGAHYLHSAIEMFNKEQTLLRKNGKVYPLNGPIYTFRVDMMYRLAFNLGMMYFKSKNFRGAFHAFVKATDLFSGDPRLWMHIAECCIRLYEISKGELGESSDMMIVKQYVGAGIYKKAVLSQKHTCLESLTSSYIVGKSPAVGPTLNYAMHALRTAWFILPSESAASDSSKESASVSQSADENDGDGTQEHSCLHNAHSQFISEEEVHKLRNFILINASYISLRNGDVWSAYTYAMKLLSQPQVSGIHQYLAHSYAAEALVSLDRISEAVDHFNPDLIKDVSTKPSNCKETLAKQPKPDAALIDSSVNPDRNLPFTTKENWSPNISDAKAIAQYNLALVHTIRGEWAKASHLLSKTNPDSPAPIKELRLYIDLCQGATDVAKNSLQHCFPSNVR